MIKGGILLDQKKKYDICIIGAGVSGANIARRLSAYQLDIIVLEKEVDFSFGVSKANSGIVHGGFHHPKSQLKARLEIAGALMFPQLADELDFPWKRCGIVVAAMHEDEMRAIEHLYLQGVDNGAIGIEMCSRERMLELEPKLSSDVVGGLWVPGGGIVEPYRFVFALLENAKTNGVELLTGFDVNKASLINADGTEPLWQVSSVDGRKIEARWVINAAGLYADEVSSVFAAEEFEIKPRKGEYYLLDRMAKARPERVIFPVPTSISKGMLIIPTVEGTTLVGPTADASQDKEDVETVQENLDKILNAARFMVPAISERDVITTFAGLRPTLRGEFFIALSGKARNFVQVAGIQSPGLTASPAIAEYVKDILKKNGIELREKPDWEPRLKKRHTIRDAGAEEVDALCAEDPAWGNIVCRCENVSEAEIVAAIKAGHTTLDGIKFFTRAQMGRCQGGFCTYKIINIIMRETGLPYDKITKRGPGSEILEGAL